MKYYKALLRADDFETDTPIAIVESKEYWAAEEDAEANYGKAFLTLMPDVCYTLLEESEEPE